jgi:hypothetical protein
MKLLKRIWDYFTQKRKQKRLALSINRAEGRRQVKVYKRIYMKNLRNKNGTLPPRKERRATALAHAKAHVAKLRKESLSVNPPKFSLAVLLLDWAYKIRLMRIKWEQQFKQTLKTIQLQPAMKGT